METSARRPELQDRSFFDFAPDVRTVKRSAVNSIIIQLVIKLKGIITMPIFTYFMLPAEMGAFNLIMVTVSMLTPLFTLNLTDGSGLYFARERSPTNIHKMFMTVVNSVGISTVVMIAAATFIVLYSPRVDIWPYAFWTGILLAANVFYKLPVSLLAVYQHTRVLVTNTIKKDICIALSSVVLVSLGCSYKGLVASASAFNLIMSYALFRIVLGHLPYRFTIDWGYLKSFLKMSLPLLPVFFFSWTVQSSGSYFLVYLKGEEAVGKLSVVYGISNIILSLTYALNFFWFPVSARLWVENREKYKNAFTAIFAAFCTILLITVIMFELNSKIIMQVLARQTEYRDAHIIMGITAFAFSMQVLVTLLTAPLYSNRNSLAIFFSYLGGGVVNTILNVLLIPGSGVLGAAISTGVSYLIVVLCMSYLNYLMAAFTFLDKRLLYIVVVFLFLWPGAAYLRQVVPYNYQVLLLNAALLMAVCAVLYYKVLSKQEIRYLRSMLREFVSREVTKA